MEIILHWTLAMLSEDRQQNVLNIVVLGDFNPAILQPSWLALKKLIKEEEAIGTKVELIHNDLVKFKVGDWLNIQITRDRFDASTTQEPYFEILRDLVISVFSILKETPVRAVGVNHVRHYTISKDKYYQLGNRIAPLDNWKLFKNPQVLNLEILEKINDEEGERITIKIQPSDTLKTANSFMSTVNHHRHVTNTSGLVTLLNKSWKDTFKLADSVEENVNKFIS